jgi:Beta/Gamma crystallin
MAEADQVRPEIILFEHADFHGAHKHIFKDVPDLGESHSQFDEKTSSIVVVKGTWALYEEKNFRGDRKDVKPDLYPDVGADPLNLDNDSISSVKLLS